MHLVTFTVTSFVTGTMVLTVRVPFLVTGTTSVTVWPHGEPHGAGAPQPATAPPDMPQQSGLSLWQSRANRPFFGAGAAHGAGQGEPQPPDMPATLTMRVTDTFSVTVV